MALTRFWLLLGVLLPLSLTACGDDAPPVTTSFAPLTYDFLIKLRLNVGSVDVQDHSAPLGDADVAGQSPVPPAQALGQMARDRLFAAGLTGQAVFTVDQASIVREPNGTLDGQMAVHLEVIGEGGGRAGYAAARVSRQHVPGSEEEDLRSVLYAMTKQMMADMNVELEYQIRRSMGSWLESGTSVPAAVVAAPLTPAVPPPPAQAPAPAQNIPGVTLVPAPGLPQQEAAPYPLAYPPAYPPAYPDGPSQQPQQLSPPPGYLQLPPGTPP